MRRLLVLVALIAGPALAEDRVDGVKLRACIDSQVAADSPVAECLPPALAPCTDLVVQAPAAALLCFTRARADFGGFMAAELGSLKDRLDADTFAALEINHRYDTLGNLIQCDRMNELQVLRLGEGETTEVQKARCIATASGLAFIKLYWQASQVREATR